MRKANHATRGLEAVLESRACKIIPVIWNKNGGKSSDVRQTDWVAVPPLLLK